MLISQEEFNEGVKVAVLTCYLNVTEAIYKDDSFDLDSLTSLAFIAFSDSFVTMFLHEFTTYNIDIKNPLYGSEKFAEDYAPDYHPEFFHSLRAAFFEEYYKFHKTVNKKLIFRFSGKFSKFIMTCMRMTMDICCNNTTYKTVPVNEYDMQGVQDALEKAIDILDCYIPLPPYKDD